MSPETGSPTEKNQFGPGAKQNGEEAAHAPPPSNNSIERAKVLTKTLPIVISSLALFVSLSSSVISYSSWRDVSKAQMIRSEYDVFDDFSRQAVANWQIAHVFALPDSYAQVKAQVVATVPNLAEEKRAELELKERGLALLLFTMFEQSYFQWKHAEEHDKDRAVFLKMLLDYHTGRALRNPRLLYFWSENGGRMETYYEQETRKYYNEHVLHDPALPLR